MFLYLLIFFGSGYAAPTDEFAHLISDKDLTFNDEKYVRNIVPASFSTQQLSEIPKTLKLSDIIDENDDLYQSLNKYMVEGYLKKGMTFNIYDENMNAAVQALFEVIQNLKDDQLEIFQLWAEKHINKEMFDYACRVNILFSNKTILNGLIHKQPTFLLKPNYYVNSEAIVKALKIRLGMFTEDEEQVNDIERYENSVVINTNNSGWNLPNNGCDEELSYFREDIGLNSYYYGLHLMHPFWMPYKIMDKIDPKHAEHYYYSHQQLLARYLLEREHLNEESRPITVDCKNTYNPYLLHDNGLLFPNTEKSSQKIETEETELKQVDILLKECIARGVIISDSGTITNVTEVDGMNSVARFVLKNLDSLKTGKKIRDVYGGQTKEEYMKSYNPAPSVLYNYQTALRDTVYWGILDYAMLYFKEYKLVLPPFDLSLYSEKDIEIDTTAFKRMSTRFEDYQFSLSTFFNNRAKYSDSPIDIQVRQKRITYSRFYVIFNVLSRFTSRIVNVKLFLGPRCNSMKACWDQYDRYFLLDSFNAVLLEGLNTLNWNPDESRRFSYDNHYNIYHNNSIENRYNTFKFPNHLVLPRGSEKGVKMTVFIIVNTIKNEEGVKHEKYSNRFNYNQLVNDDDKKPLGFPFHQPAKNYEAESTNYKFFNVTIYHDEEQS